MELNIYNKDGSLKLTVSPSDSSTVTEEVGGECSVSLSFDTYEFRPIEVNDYIEVTGVRYKARMAYRPKMKNRQAYSYSLRFYAPIHDAEQALMKTETDGGLISEFSLWGGPREHLQKWVDNMNRLAGSELWSIGSVITGENKNIDYRNVNCWDAAFGSNGIASTYETEMWADGYVINLCKCERGERITLGYGAGLTSLTPEDNSNKVRFFTRLFPLGSTRNINVSTYGSSRLQLPSRATFVDHNTDRYGVFEDSEEAAFADIFPQYIGTVSAVRSESKTDENGKKFTVYYIKDSGMIWEPKALPEQSFMLSFQTGDLQGYGDDTNKSFQAEWHKDTKEWEIINIWLDENTQVPGGNIVPVVGNQYFPWNMIMPQEYITEAEKRYEAAVNDFVANYSGEPVAYSGSTDYIHCAKQAVPLRIGQNVRLESDLYFEDGFQNTRITKVVRKLCRLTDATVTFAEQIGTGWKKSVDNQLSSLHYELQRQAEQAGIDVIKTTDSKTPSDNNVFSALRSLATFLRKDRADVMPYLLTLLQGVSFKGDKGISSEGAAKLLSAIFGEGTATIDADGASAFKSATVREGVTSDNFSTGALGSGFALKKDENNDSYLEVDRMMVRKIAIFVELLIQRLRHVGGQIVISPASMTCERVEDRADAYRCYFRSTDGSKTVVNEFVVGDQARCQTFNIKPGVHENVSNAYYWRLVTAVGDDYIDLSKTDCDRGSTVPQAGDDIVQLGNRNDATRQCAIVLAAHGAGAPYLKMYRNINNYVMSDADEIINLSKEKVRILADEILMRAEDGNYDSVTQSIQQSIQKAEEALTAATNTKNRLDDWASDKYFSPAEKAGLNEEYIRVVKDVETIRNDASRYGITYPDSILVSYISAADMYSNLLYTIINDVSEVVAVPDVFHDFMTSYYDNRVAVLQHIATAAKDYADNINQALEDYKGEVSSEFQQTKELIEGKVSRTEWDGVQITGRNLILKSNEKLNGTTHYLIKTYNLSLDLVPNEKYTLVICGSTSEGQQFGAWVNGGNYRVGLFPVNMQANEVQYIHITMPDSITAKKQLAVYNVPNPGGISKPCHIEWIALYKGHIKPTLDWQAAPEELEGTMTQHSSRITQLANIIETEVKKEISGLNKTTRTLSSRITQTAENISIKVNEVIGGENLIDGASFLDNGGLVGWSMQGNMTAKIVFNEAKLGNEKCLELYLMEKGCGIWKALSPKGAAVMDDEVTYTISFDLFRAYDEPYFIQIGVQEEFVQNMDLSQVPLNQWRRVSFTRTIGKHQGSNFGMYFYPNADGCIYIKKLKVELGSKATEWTESDRDVLLSTGIDITNKSIVLTAENTVIQSSNGQRVAMFETDSEGKPWIRGENVDATNLTAQKIITRRDNGARVEIVDSEINIFGDVARNIQFGVDEDGYAVLRYFDNEGKLLYKLGFSGLVQKPSRPESWSSTWLYKTGDTELQAYNDGKYKDWVYKTGNQRYIYNCEIKEGVYMDEVNDGRTTTHKLKSPSFRLNGWYVKAPSRSGESHNWTEIERLDPNNPGGEIRLPGMSAAHPPVYNRKPLYTTQMYLYKDGVRIKTHNVYFNG